MSAEANYRIVTVAMTPQSARSLERYIAVLTAARQAEHQLIVIGNADSHERLLDSVQEEIQDLACRRLFDLMMVEWVEDADLMSRLGKLARDLNVDVLFVRDQPDRVIRRILILTGGGTHSIEGLRVSRELASAWNSPIEVLRIIRVKDQPLLQTPLMKEYLRQVWELTRFQLRMMELPTPIKLRVASSVVEEIVSRSREDDLIVLGGPNPWRLEQHLAGSIPHDIARSVSCPLLMVSARKKGHASLHEIFWEDTVRMNLKSLDKWDAIAQLVDALVTERQVPIELRDQVLEAAWERECLLPTSAGYETAIPHAAIAEFKGIVGALGICPEGIDFGSLNQNPVRFIFLLLTPKENYSEYLVVLSRIARLMYNVQVRQQLLCCKTPAEVAALIDRESRQEQHSARESELQI